MAAESHVTHHGSASGGAPHDAGAHGSQGSNAGHEAPATGMPPVPLAYPVDISRRSDRENGFILILVIVGLIWLLVHAADLTRMKALNQTPAKPWRQVR